MITLVSSQCGQLPTFLFCLDRPGIVATPGVIPAVPLVVNTFNLVKGGAVLNEVPLPATAAIGDTIAVKYLGGNVALVLPPVAPSTVPTTVYSFNPVGDLNKVIVVKWDGLTWVLS